MRCPLVVVADIPTPDDAPIGVALEANGAGALALEWVLSNPLFAGRPVKVVSVCRAPQSRIFWLSVSQDQVDAAMERAEMQQAAQVAEVVGRHTDVPEVTTEVRYGSPVDELASFSETVSVLVIEADVRFPTYSVGSVARGLMTFANCPVILVK